MKKIADVRTIKYIHNYIDCEHSTRLLSYTEEVSLEIRYRVVKRAATLATGPRPQKLAADARIQPPRPSQAT